VSRRDSGRGRGTQRRAADGPYPGGAGYQEDLYLDAAAYAVDPGYGGHTDGPPRPADVPIGAPRTYAERGMPPRAGAPPRPPRAGPRDQGSYSRPWLRPEDGPLGADRPRPRTGGRPRPAGGYRPRPGMPDPGFMYGDQPMPPGARPAPPRGTRPGERFDGFYGSQADAGGRGQGQWQSSGRPGRPAYGSAPAGQGQGQPYGARETPYGAGQRGPGQHGPDQHDRERYGPGRGRPGQRGAGQHFPGQQGPGPRGPGGRPGPEQYGPGMADYGPGAGPGGPDLGQPGAGMGGTGRAGSWGPGTGQYGPGAGQYDPGMGSYGPGMGAFGPGAGAGGSGASQHGPGMGQYGPGGQPYGPHPGGDPRATGAFRYGPGSGQYGPNGGQHGPGAPDAEGATGRGPMGSGPGQGPSGRGRPSGRPHPYGPDPYGPSQSGPGQYGPDQYGPGQSRAGQYGPGGQFGPGQPGPGHHEEGPYRSGQWGPGGGPGAGWQEQRPGQGQGRPGSTTGRLGEPPRPGDVRPDLRNTGAWLNNSGHVITQRDSALPEPAPNAKGAIASIEADNIAAFARDLRVLRSKAGLDYPDMAEKSHYTMRTLASAAGGLRLPTLPVLIAYVKACNGDLSEWEERWGKLVKAGKKGHAALPVAGAEASPGEPGPPGDAPRTQGGRGAGPGPAPQGPPGSGEVYVITSARPRDDR
jgi:hypothetical protein